MRLPRRELTEKLNKVKDNTAAIGWRAQQPQECMCCGWKLIYDLGPKRGLSVHHMAGAAGRSDEPCNFLLVCYGDRGCHEAIHAGKIDLDAQLAAKELCDPNNYDPVRVMQLKGKHSESCSPTGS